MNKVIKNKKGITLVELLAVIVIMAIITAIAVPLIGNLITSTRESAAAADGNTVYASLRLYALENSDITVSFDFTGDDTTKATALTSLTAAIGPYISVVPTSITGITFSVVETKVTVTAAAGAEINGYAVAWLNNAFVRPE
ncbi:MAG: type II secretion system protein [Clostridia bacterium]|jgi:type IV pilus assembly protein PilA